jgi:hypothetical protein
MLGEASGFSLVSLLRFVELPSKPPKLLEMISGITFEGFEGVG